MKKLLGFIASAFISTSAYSQVWPTSPNIYSFYCDECYTEYARLMRLNESLNGPCCWEDYSVPCCTALGQGIRNALDFYRACGENCTDRPWWAIILDPRFSFEEFEYLLESYQIEDEI